METDTFKAFPALIRHFSYLGDVLWIDSSNAAKTHYFEDSPGLLEKISIARAFTALQHHQLCARLGEYDLVVAPEIDRLYLESSLYDSEASELFRDAAEKLEGRILYSTVGSLGEVIPRSNTIKVKETEQGLRYSDGESSSKTYSLKDGVQTTVEAFGERKWEERTARIETDWKN